MNIIYENSFRGSCRNFNHPEFSWMLPSQRIKYRCYWDLWQGPLLNTLSITFDAKLLKNMKTTGRPELDIHIKEPALEVWSDGENL